MIAFVLAVALASGVTTAQADSPTVSLSDADAVKASYAAASYDDALQRIAALEPERVTPQIEQYRALSLLALGRGPEAEQAFERLVRKAPLYRITDSDVSPRIATMFRDVRRRVLPSVARELYARGKSSYDQKQFSEASDQLRELLTVLSDPDLEGQNAGVDDLKQLAEGFIRLAEVETALAARAAAPPPPPPVAAVEPVAPPAPDPTAPTVTKIVIYSASDTGVTPPEEIERRMPPWVPPPVIARSNAEYRGELEVVVNEAGAVEAAFMVRPTVPSYDLTLLESARRWRFKAATLKGQAVKYRLTYNVALTPRK
jgi:tetratricopeptide (TPR) repeat protein